jgi:hopanoid-associated phosphorylase
VTILAATGLKREAQILAGPGVTPVVSGARVPAFEAALVSAAEGAEAILSIGIGGATVEGLAIGDVVVATGVVADGLEVKTDPQWTAAIRERLPQARAGVICGSDAMLTHAADQAAACIRFFAIAVDMESHVAARVAERFGLPFAAVRVISDRADQDLPEAVTVGMSPDGGMAVLPVLARLARNPAQLPALIRTATEAETAIRALTATRRQLGPRLGFAG